MLIEKKKREEIPTPKKHHDFFIRIPVPLHDRIMHQSKRLGCTANAIARMAFNKFIEEEESIERRMETFREKQSGKEENVNGPMPM